MSDRMKILIGYEGSECADAALRDLERAGLPAEADVLVMTVAEVFLPPPIREEDMFPPHIPVAIQRAHERRRKRLHRRMIFRRKLKHNSQRCIPTGKCGSQGDKRN